MKFGGKKMIYFNAFPCVHNVILYINPLMNRKENQMQLIEDLKAQIDGMNTDIEDLTQEVDKLETDLRDIENERDEAVDDAESYESQLNEAIDEIFNGTQIIEDLSSELEEHDEENSVLDTADNYCTRMRREY